MQTSQTSAVKLHHPISLFQNLHIRKKPKKIERYKTLLYLQNTVD